MISLIDHTTGTASPPPGTLTSIAAALTKQVQHDFGGRWYSPRPAVVVGRLDVAIPVHLFNDPDTAGALGYHDVDTHGLPYARVFASPALDNGSGWTTGEYAVSATISHEVLETLGDRTANLFAPTADGTEMWAFEACDAVEALSYEIDGIPVSDFVLPAFFNPSAGPPYDHLGTLSRHFEIAPGGYTITASVGQIGQQTGDTAPPAREVRFDDAMPEWRRVLKMTPGSRTTWRQILGRGTP